MKTVDNSTTVSKDLFVNQTLRSLTTDRNIWKPIVKKAIDDCLTPERSEVNATGPWSCKPFFNTVLHCFHVELLKKCPPSHFYGSDNCVLLKTYANECNSIPKHNVYKYN